MLKSLQNIATIQPGEKLSTVGGCITRDSRPNPVTRWLNGDRRSTSLLAIHTVLDEAFVSLDVNVNNLITQVPGGLENLKETYKSDASFCNSVDAIINRVKNYVR
jgi:hypothetical protein